MGFQLIATVVCTALVTLLLRWVFCEYLGKGKQSPKNSEESEPVSEKPVPQYITIGSSKQDVLSVLGTPKNVIGSTWFYHAGNVDFSFGRVRYVQAYADESYMHFRVDPSKL